MLLFFLVKKLTGSGAIALPASVVVGWMMCKLDIRYYPAMLLSLAISVWCGRVMLIMSVILVLMNLWSLRAYYPKHIVSWFFFLLLPVPLLLWWGAQNFLSARSAPATAFAQLSMYLALFPFFFGLLLSKQFTKKDSMLLLVTSLIICVLAFFAYERLPELLRTEYDADKEYIRAEFIVFPIVYCCALYGVFHPRLLWCTAVGGILFLIASFTGNTLTLLGTAMMAFIILCGVLMRSRVFIKLLNSMVPYLTSMLFVVFVILNFEKYSVRAYDKAADYDELKLSLKWRDIQERIMMKTFDDRAVLWNASWKYVLDAPKWVPNNSYIPQVLSIEDSNFKQRNIDLSSHNVYLEVLRQLRFGVGGFFLVGYFAIFIFGGRLLRLPCRDIIFTIILVSVLTVGIVGSTTGHFILLANVSFMFTSILGLSYGLYCRELQQRFARLNAPNRVGP
jgi:hypothetical protein